MFRSYAGITRIRFKGPAHRYLSAVRHAPRNMTTLWEMPEQLSSWGLRPIEAAPRQPEHRPVSRRETGCDQAAVLPHKLS
ncbi:hypothetical protein CHELA40_14577 [Chelatococcus asaccharovorans]|nr:hypothetical protein CHELA17_61042 [Chelatococcus asaccharovorans]CAH1678506.1 hypothetical protein CHELA40_14577 [Chelatococcus asaccharovorans]